MRPRRLPLPVLAVATSAALALTGAAAAPAGADTAATPAPASAAATQSSASAAVPGGYVFSPYIDMTGDPAPDLPALVSDSGAHHLTLGFVVTPAPGWCSPTWSGYLADPAWGPDAYQAAEVAAFQAAGNAAAVSFGGEYGTEPAEGCTSERALTAAYTTVMAAYHPVRLDFDIEGSDLTDTAATIRRADVLAAIEREQAAAGQPLRVSFTLPATPDGLTPAAEQLLAETIARGVRIDYVNLMTMDFGTPGAAQAGGMGIDAADAATGAAQQLASLYPGRTPGQLAHMIGLTPMIGVNDIRSDVFGLADAEHLAAAARSAHVGLVSMWQLARDGSCGPADVGAACSGVDQRPFAFSFTLGAGSAQAPPATASAGSPHTSR